MAGSFTACFSNRFKSSNRPNYGLSRLSKIGQFPMLTIQDQASFQHLCHYQISYRTPVSTNSNKSLPINFNNGLEQINILPLRVVNSSEALVDSLILNHNSASRTQ
ncbi:hypothetical protein L5515_017302 [Caenorhabditis briggsae]|uniref:Uncharacterized protein n=1 Tax=Caenorhabditis briggsae TaxID=6238 RepID=A0AAE9FDY7_CAEBR|nr:hypothetical protein L5515_017302 [Caenorhabditis briggsae]